MQTNRKNNFLLIRSTLTIIIFTGIASCSSKNEKLFQLNNSYESWMMLPFTKPDEFIFMADRWNKTNLEDSRYVWLPLIIKTVSISIQWQASWSLGNL